MAGSVLERWKELYGDAVRRVVAERLPSHDDDVIEWIVLAVLLHATHSAPGRRFPDAPDAEEWVAELTAGYCARLVATGEIDEVGRTLDQPAPSPNDESDDPILDTIREGRRRRLRGETLGLLLIPRRLRDALLRGGRSAADAVRERAALLDLQQALAAAPAIREAVAAVGLVVGLGASPAAAAPSGPETAALDAVAAVAGGRPFFPGSNRAGSSSATSGAVGEPGRSPREASPSPSPPSNSGDETTGATPFSTVAVVPKPQEPATPRPGATINPAPPEKPFTEVPDDDGSKTFTTPSTPLAVDLEGDGDNEVTASTPQVFTDCPDDPAERGPVSGAICDVADATQDGA